MRFTIPVRVAAGTRPPRAGDEPLWVAFDHPLAGEDCPVCGEELGGRHVHLVIVGAEPGEARPGRAWFTGAAVAVHVECALPDEDPPAHVVEAALAAFAERPAWLCDEDDSTRCLDEGCPAAGPHGPHTHGPGWP